MKSGVAAMIYAAKAVQDAGPFPGRIVVGALVDEEGMMLGAKHFARTPLAAEVDGVIVCEPEGGEICAVAKGAVRLRIELTGVMAHGAMPPARPQPAARGGPRHHRRWSGCSSGCRTSTASTSTSAGPT